MKRADGQVVQLPKLLYLVAERIDGRRSYEDISEEVSEELQAGLGPEDVAYLVAEKLAPLGVAAGPEGTPGEIQSADPLLALRFKKAVVPKGLVRAVTSVFFPLFFLPILVGAVVGLAILDFWMFGSHGIAQSLRATIFDPSLLLALFGVVVVTAAFHECGHATGCRYGGAEPGVMGVGLYLVWPAFYTDLTDTYRLGKWGRLRADLGGVYFNTLFVLATAGLYFLTHFEPLLLVILLLQLEILVQFMPFLRMDGYYMVADVTGVPDLFARIGAIFKSLIPWREADPRVKELKTWVRVVVTAWVLIVVPVLLFNLAMIVISAPRIFSTAWTSLTQHASQMTSAFGAGRIADGSLGLVQCLALGLPALGIVYMLVRLVRRVGSKALAWSEGRAGRRAVVVTGAAALIGVLVYIWLPNGDYRPIQRGERWTVADGVRSISHVGGGDPGVVLGGKAASPAAGGFPSDVGSGASPTPTPSASPSTSLSPSSSPSSTAPAPSSSPSAPVTSPPVTATSPPTPSPAPSPSPSSTG